MSIDTDVTGHIDQDNNSVKGNVSPKCPGLENMEDFVIYSVQNQKYATKILITHERGLHLSPSSLIVEDALTYSSDMRISNYETIKKLDKDTIKELDKITDNAKRTIEVMCVGALKNEHIVMTADGEDAVDALESQIKLAKNKYGFSH